MNELSRTDSQFIFRQDFPTGMWIANTTDTVTFPNACSVCPERKNVFPDVIVHERGAPGPNLLVVEAKKSSDLNDENEAFD
jgi:hypothetical protein